MVFDINGWEFLLQLIIGIVALGPERLPDYAASTTPAGSCARPSWKTRGMRSGTKSHPN